MFKSIYIYYIYIYLLCASKDLGDLLMITKDRNKWRRCCMKYSYCPAYDARVVWDNSK